LALSRTGIPNGMQRVISLIT